MPFRSYRSGYLSVLLSFRRPLYDAGENELPEFDYLDDFDELVLNTLSAIIAEKE